MHLLVPRKADPITKKHSGNWGMVGASSAGGIEMFLALLGGLWVWDNWLQLSSLGAELFCQACMGRHTQRSRVRFCKSEVPSLQSLKTF